MEALLIFILTVFCFFSKRKGLSLFFLASLLTGGFWIIGKTTTLFGMSIRLTDLALAYVFIILIYSLLKGNLKTLPKELKSVYYFFFFLLIAVIVDFIFHKTSLGDIFRTTRHWYFILFVFILPSFNKRDIILGFKFIIYFTFFQLILFLTEPVTGKVLFSSAGTMEALKMTGVERYTFLPRFNFFFFALVFSTEKLDSRIKFSMLFLFFAAILITTTRSYLIISFLIIALSLFISKRQGILKKIGIITVLIAIIMGVTFYKPINSRFVASVGDVNSINDVRTGGEGNVSFRFLLFAERLNHILIRPETTVFGIGFVSEENYKGDSFNIGLYNEDNEIVNLDTADIAWALFALRLGLLGSFLYLFIYFSLFRYFWRNRSNSYALTGVYYIIIYLFLSLSSSNLYNGVFIFIPALLYQVVKNTKREMVLL